MAKYSQKKKALPSSLLKKLRWIKWLVAAIAAWTVVARGSMVGEIGGIQNSSLPRVIYVNG
jgi:hypothetical protein